MEPESYIHTEIMAEMRWRRDTEYKLLAIYLTIAAGSLAALVAAIDKPAAAKLLVASAVIFLVRHLYAKMKTKVEMENEKYKELALVIRRIREQWGVFEPRPPENVGLLPESMRKFGEGDGYKQTIALMEFACDFTSVCAVVLLISPVSVYCIATLLTK